MCMNPSEKQIELYLFIAFAFSLIATLGSLYFSEVLLFVPCELCWFQRIFMYPLVIILGIAALKRNYKIALYTFVLSAIGGLISIYHYLIQKVPAIGETSSSCGIIPCTTQYINWLGFITIPFLALIGFSTIAIMSFLIIQKSK